MTDSIETEVIPRYRPPLDSMKRVRQELAKVYRQAKNSEIPLADATRYTYILQALARMLATETLEARIAALEAESGQIHLQGERNEEFIGSD